MNKYHPGQLVRISDRTEHRHHRVPEYAKGQIGIVSELCSYASLPEEIASWKPEPEVVPVYRIHIPLTDLWHDYLLAKDSLEIEVYENWLSAA